MQRKFKHESSYLYHDVIGLQSVGISFIIIRQNLVKIHEILKYKKSNSKFIHVLVFYFVNSCRSKE